MKQKKYFQAECAFTKAIELDPQNFQAYCSFSSLYCELKMEEEAELMLDKALAFAPKTTVSFIALGFAHMDFKKYEDAERIFRKSIEIDPKDSNSYQALGVMYSTLNRFHEAEAIYKEALEIKPQREVYDLSAVAQLALGKRYEALKNAKIAQEMGLTGLEIFKELGLE